MTGRPARPLLQGASSAIQQSHGCDSLLRQALLGHYFKVLHLQFSYLMAVTVCYSKPCYATISGSFACNSATSWL